MKNIFAKALPILTKVAPGIAAAIGGPIPAVAAAAVQALADSLGDATATPENVALKVAGASPDQMLAFKQADNAFQTRMAEIGVDVFRLEIEDRKDARLFGSKMNNIPQIVLTLVFYLGFFATTWWVLTQVAPDIGEFQKTALIYLLGILSGEIPRMQQYWFGSSSSSREKNTMLANMRPPA